MIKKSSGGGSRDFGKRSGEKPFKSSPDKRDKPADGAKRHKEGRSAPGEDKFKPKEEKFAPKQDKYKAKEDKFKPKEGKFAPKQDKYKAKEDKFAPKEGKFASKEERYKPKDGGYSPKESRPAPKDGKYPPREEKRPSGGGKYPSKDAQYKAKGEKHSSRDGKSSPKKGSYAPREEKPYAKDYNEENSEVRKAPKDKASYQPRPARARKDWDKDDRAQREAPEDDRLILKGRHEVVQALESGQTIDSVVISTAVKGPVGKIVRELAGKSQIPVKEMNPDLFELKFGEKSQGIVAIGGSFTYCSLEEIAEKAAAGHGILVALNHIEDARNLGAIVRTVEASGCCGILLPKHRSAGMSEWAIRTAQGAASYLPVARVNNIGDALEQLKSLGYWIVGLDGDAEKRYDQVVYSGKLVLVAGGEDAGLGERVRKVCDDVVAIPLAGKTPSLNVSVSTAVVLYEIIRQKQFFQK